MATEQYFAPILPWQQSAWQQFIRQSKQQQLPHGILAAGVAGVGKRAFVWKMAAYLLCATPSDVGACGHCEQCQWLQAGTHPDLLVLPSSSALGADGEIQNIKIEDIRYLQEFAQTTSKGVRVIVLDRADSLTLAAANALLKTLEEPRSGVFLLLISDYPARLLPTIKSRVQPLPLLPVDQQIATQYLSQEMSVEQARQLLRLTDGAVLAAKALSEQAWFGLRATWLATVVALINQSRIPMAASEYWQTTLSLEQFCRLSRMMIADLYRVLLGLPSLHDDLSVAQKLDDLPISTAYLQDLLACFDEVQNDGEQNIQEKFAYDRLMVQFANTPVYHR